MPSRNIIAGCNLVGGDCVTTDKLLEDNGIVAVGFDNKYTTRCGGYQKHIDKLQEVTHIIAYKAKKHYKSFGGVYKNIYKISNFTIIEDIEAYQKHSGISPGVDMSHELWKGKEDWYAVEGSAAIVWDAKLVKEITIPFKDSHIRTRTRFGSVNENHEIYNLI